MYIKQNRFLLTKLQMSLYTYIYVHVNGAHHTLFNTGQKHKKPTTDLEVSKTITNQFFLFFF